ncbi:MAG: Xaa-Pro aminopeptidase [Saprospiraceae bacterium]|jgi:Xaa-Pro aminopeptidase
MFSAATYTKRRQALKEKLGSGVVLLLGNEDSPMNYKTNTYHFRQDSSFLYYFGLDMPHLVGIIDIENNEEVIFGDELTLDDVIWTGPQITINELASNVGVAQTMPYRKIGKVLHAAQAQRKTIHFLPTYRAENQVKLSAYFDLSYDAVPQHASVNLIKAVVAQRAIKSNEEIVEMEKAVNTSRMMHVAAMRMTRPGMIEQELVGKVTDIAIAHGGNLSYPAIMTVNGQTLHNHHHHNALKSGQMVLGDFGAETAMHYAGDITRTFPVDKTFTDRQKDIYNIVLKAEEDCIASLRPDLPYQQVHLNAAMIIAEGLKSLGLMKGNVEDAVRAGAHALFFPHGLGHMIGLDVHDMEDLGEDYVGYNENIKRIDQFGTKYLRLGRKLEAGFVLTVEPGIYFIPELIDQWHSEGRHSDFLNFDKIATYKDFSGIRLEDNVLITADGHRVLGDRIPKTVEEVEGIRNE